MKKDNSEGVQDHWDYMECSEANGTKLSLLPSVPVRVNRKEE